MPRTIDVLPDASLSDIAHLIRADWRKPYFGAVPYLNAMTQLYSIDDPYGCDDGRSIVAYFLSNASTWRGETARAVKAELKRRAAAPRRRDNVARLPGDGWDASGISD